MQQIVSRGHTRPLTEISFVRDGDERTLLVSSAHDKLPQIRNGETGDWIGSFEGHKGAVWSCKVDALTRTLAATASGDFSAKLWCANTGKELLEFKHKHVVKSVDFSIDSERIATGCQDGLVRVFSTCAHESIPVIEIRVSADTAGAPTKVLWSASDTNTLIVGKRNGYVEMWDIRTPSAAAASLKIPSSNNGDYEIKDLELNAALDCLLVCSGSTVSMLSAANCALKRQYTMPSPCHFKEEGGCSLCPDGTKFIAGGSDLWLREFDVESGEVLRTFKGHHGPIRAVRYHPAGLVGASASEDATIRLWDLSPGTEGSK